MDLVERLAEGNREYCAQVFTDEDASRSAIPRLRLAVVACMDARHVPERVLGLEPGDAKVIRSAGAIVDDGVLRSLVAAVHFLQVQNVLVMPHTDCGMRGLGHKKGDLAKRLEGSLGHRLDDAELERTLAWLQPFEDPERLVKQSLDRIRGHELLPKGLVLMGSVYDNKTGAVRMLTD